MATQAQRESIQKLIARNKASALFDKSEDFIGLFEQYLESIKKDPDEVPSYSNFATWLGKNTSSGVSANSIYKYMRNNPDARDATAELMADALVEGALKGLFRDAPAIFALKNRCNWTDKKESINHHDTADIATPDEARENIRKIMRSLGYDDRGRPRKETFENVDAMNERIIQLAEAKVGR